MKASLATILCLAISGCLGYHVGPVKPYYLRDVHTIAVPTFKNRTLVPRIEVLVTDTVIKQFQQDGTFQITSDDKADATLSGEISRINRLPARSVRGNVLATTEFNLALSVKYLAHYTRRQTAGRSGRSNRYHQFLCHQRRNNRRTTSFAARHRGPRHPISYSTKRGMVMR